MKPKISVVMPTFNRGHVIQNAIRSIIDQTFKEWELIIVDDGSTDGTKRIVESYAHPNIKFISMEHSGCISKVRNKGNQLAQGELIVVQDSDDQSFPDRLEEIWKTYILTGADLIYHGMYLRFYDPYHNSIVRGVRPALSFDKAKLLVTQYIPGQVAYKRETVLEVPYNEDINVCDDYMILLDFALKDKKFERIEKYLYDYVDSQDSVNILGEQDGRRKRDVGIIMKRLEDKYGIKDAAIMKILDNQ